jgi:hypothetical protein
MSRRFVELVVRARRFVTRGPEPVSGVPVRRTARRGPGEELTQFSFRLALMIDLAYVGIGALGGAAIGRAAVPPSAASAQPGCDGHRLPTPVPLDTTADSLSTVERTPAITTR